MSEIDWSKAPEGVFVWIEVLERGRRYDDGWHYEAGDKWVDSRGNFWPMRSERDGMIIVHRKPEITAWNGEGLPPVGTVCEAFRGLDQGWEVVKILDHQTKTAACRQNGSNLLFWCSKFRPIRTPEQIAAEERERAYKGMVDDLAAVIGISNIDARECDVLHALADAGYRRVDNP